MIQRTTKKRWMIRQTTKKCICESASALSAKALQTPQIQQSLLYGEKTGLPLLFDSSVSVRWITTLVPLAPSESWNSFGLVPVQIKTGLLKISVAMATALCIVPRPVCTVNWKRLGLREKKNHAARRPGNESIFFGDALQKLGCFRSMAATLPPPPPP